MRWDSKKLNWKNIKYIIKKVINLYLMKFNISLGLNNAFYINKLYLINNNPLLNQFINDTQPSPIQKNRIKEYIIKNIIAEKKRKIKKRLKKEYKMK